ncbi:3-dehydro-L-gulonate 2-dehydrogenase [Saccharicrinis sp. FJH54]|uniref:3-dehydro-L-gulonate 2-dehydrogenase n=1 Tax=Saccharicrinis sp. FJH54 TaxID=3344665 RepID=UPI0035D502DD
MLVSPDDMQDVLFRLFLKKGFSTIKATVLAEVYTSNTVDGVNSHGINRVKQFLDYVEWGLVEPDAEARIAGSFGTMERWDGNLGPGIINAAICTNRAVELAKMHGMGLVALRNTNHWMRGGTYGWQAADAGCMAIMFTNTKPNMPAWGGKESRIGNNPFVIAIPRKQGHVVLDMALSQFSFGKINSYRLKGEKLPYPGGWDPADHLSDDPEKILVKERGLPIGYWKGSALSMVLDMLATLLSAGDSTFRVGQKAHESGVSQIFMCVYPERFGDDSLQDKLLDEIIRYTHDVEPMKYGDRTYYPGERTLITRKNNLKNGVPVEESIWMGILNLLKKDS